MAVKRPFILTPQQKLGMGLKTRVRIAFDWLYTLILTPFLATHCIFDIVLILLFPFARQCKQWNLNQAVRVRVVRLVLLFMSLVRAGDRLSLKPGKERNRFEVIRPQSESFYQGPLSDPLIKPDIIGTTWTPARPPAKSLIRPDLIVALHIHGGGFVVGNGRDSDTGYFAQCLLKHMGVTHVSTPQYRLSSSFTKNGRFPAPVQDALTSYLHLIRERGIPAKQIIISGDSAGGNIALSLVRYISEFGAELDIPAPGGVALWSPWVDVHAATDLTLNVRMSPNYGTDFICTEFARWGSSAVIGWGRIDPAGPYLSPLHHPFKMGDGEVPLFVHAGGAEVLVDDVKEFARRFEGAGWNKVHLGISEHCPHDILLLGDRFGFEREAEEAAREAGRFFVESTGWKLRIQG